MENVEVFNRPIGNYKTIHVLCNLNNADYLEVTKYPDGDIVVSMDTNMPEGDIILTIEQLEKLVEELKE
ncbi:hypothetical protein [Enterococcus phage vB_Efa_VP15]|nr:hypothetical protein [Enterococcus phage vB_Efa_VP15]